MESFESIPINLIRQWFFCPRIPYYQELLQNHIVRPTWVSQGLEYESIQSKLFKRRNLSRFNLSQGILHKNVFLQSGKLKIHGIADMIIETEEKVFIIEIKLNLPKISWGTQAQLLALSLLAQEKFNKKADKTFIIYGEKSKVKVVKFTKEQEKSVLNAIAQIKTILEKGVKPTTSASLTQCSQCEYINYCNDRF